MDRKGPRSWRWILLPKAHELRRKTTATAEASGFLPSWIASSKKPTAFLFCDRWAMRVSLCGKENRNFKREFSSPVLFLQNVCERHQFHVLQTRGYGLLENAPLDAYFQTHIFMYRTFSLSLSISRPYLSLSQRHSVENAISLADCARNRMSCSVRVGGSSAKGRWRISSSFS